MGRFFTFRDQKRTSKILPGLVPRLALYFSALFLAAIGLTFYVAHFGVPFTSLKGIASDHREDEFKRLGIVADFKKERLLRLVYERKGDIRIQVDDELIRSFAHRIQGALQAHDPKDPGESVVRRIARADGQYGAVIRRFQLLAAAYPGMYQNIQLADPFSGRVFASLNGDDLGKKPALDIGPTGAAGKDEFSVDILKPQDTDTYEFFISHPVPAGADGPRAAKSRPVLIAQLALDAVMSPLLDTSEGLGKTGEVVLLSKTGILLTPGKIYRSSKGVIARPLESLTPAVPLRVAIEGKEGRVEGRDYRDVAVFAATRFIPLSPDFSLGMVVKEDRTEVMSGIYKEMGSDIMRHGLVLILTLGIFFASLRKLSARIASISDAISEMEFGNTAAWMGGKDDELAVLTESLEAMLGKIDEKQGQLEAEIAERKKTEAALMENEERYRAILESSPDLIAVSIGGVIVYVNRAGVEMMGATGPAEIIGSPVSKFLLPAERDMVDARRNKAIHEWKEMPVIEQKLVRLDGKVLDVEGRISPLVYNGEKAVQAIIRDKTDFRRAEMALKESEERFKNAFESATIGMAIISTFGQWLQVNEVLVAMTGYSKDELHEMTFQGLMHPDDVDKDIALSRKLVSGELKRYSSIKRYITRSGNLIYTQESISLVRDKNGQPLYFIAQIQDITEKEKLQGEMAKMQKLESLGALAGGIAHDFNNMLAAIISRIALAKLGAPNGSGMLTHLQMAEKAVMKARNLTQQLLTFSRDGAPVKKAMPAAQFIQGTVEFIMHGSPCGCTVRLADDLPEVEIDEGQVSQVINNIFINAMQEMPVDGIIKVAAANIEITAASPLPLAPGRYVEISIADAGRGIAPDVIGRIFDPFFSTKQKGRGLGLSISYSIIKKHKGHIGVESALGKGTTFHIYLPAMDKKARAGIPAAAAPMTGKRILVMDDDELFIAFLQTGLEEQGFRITATFDGEALVRTYAEALERNEKFDVVICDLTVPSGKGGEYAIRELMKIDPGVKAIVSSAYQNTPAMAYYREHGFKGFLVKPYDMETLNRILTEVLDNGAA